jgi:capsular polysaccharide biosynthesis protein
MSWCGKSRKASINSSFQNSSIRIADPARPPMAPVFPSVQLNLLVACVASLLLLCGVAILSDLVDHTLRDPEQVMRTLSTVVYWEACPVLRHGEAEYFRAQPGSK